MITIIDYGVGNLESVKNALNQLRIESAISSDTDVLRASDGVILPGVGSANEGMKNLTQRGLDQTLRRLLKRGKPFLGICLGMQLLFDTSEEGNTRCLGILKGEVKRYQRENKVPQIGWNTVTVKKPISPLLNGIPNNSAFYFVNSYYCDPSDVSTIIGSSTYGEEFASVIEYKNISATQFHPEKSGKIGFQLLSNFLRRCL